MQDSSKAILVTVCCSAISIGISIAIVMREDLGVEAHVFIRLLGGTVATIFLSIYWLLYTHNKRRVEAEIEKISGALAEHESARQEIAKIEASLTEYEDIRHEIAQLARLSPLIKWVEKSDTHEERVYSTMAELSAEEDTTGLDVFMLLNRLSPSDTSGAQSAPARELDRYYRALEHKMTHPDNFFRYRRVIVHRKETLAYHLAVRPRLRSHLKRAQDYFDFGNEGGIWSFAATSRLFDFAFGLFYSGTDCSDVKALVLELGRWSANEERQLLGLLVLQSPPTVVSKQIAAIFGELVEQDDLRDIVLPEPIQGLNLPVPIQIRKRSMKLMGYPDVIERPESLPGDCIREDFGGGFVFRSKNERIRHIHIVPHGGSALELGHGISLEKFFHDGMNNRVKAREILETCDSCVSGIANRIIASIQSGEGPWAGSALAFFEVPRMIADANRTEDGKQIPSLPLGAVSARKELTYSEKEEIRALVADWIRGVEAFISDDCIAFHHHTFNAVGRTDVRHDKAPFEVRPPGQLFLESPVDGSHVAPREALLDPLKEIFEDGIASLFSRWEIQYDMPLKLPHIPFIELGRGHFIYEVREDLLIGEKSLDVWMSTIETMLNTALDLKNP